MTAIKNPVSPATKPANQPAKVRLNTGVEPGSKGSSRQVQPSNTARPAVVSGVDKEERRQMIAEAAYYRFTNRGCRGGSDLEDWLAAEEEVNRMLDF